MSSLTSRVFLISVVYIFVVSADNTTLSTSRTGAAPRKSSSFSTEGPVAVTTVNAQTTATHCQFDGQMYAVGEHWRPFLASFGVMDCINCTCLNNGQVKCSREECNSPPCDEPRQVEGKCCPICTDNIPPRQAPDKPRVYKSCSYKGRTYAHAQLFPSSDTALESKRRDQCVLCFCLNGDVFCHLKTCLPKVCDHPIYVDNDCCPVCRGRGEDFGWTIDMQGGRDEVEGYEALDLFSTNPATLDAIRDKHKDCQSGNRRYTHGAEWHPFIGPFGRITCITCSCRYGNIVCKRQKCTPVEDLPCHNPVLLPGKCCKVCVEDNDSQFSRNHEIDAQTLPPPSVISNKTICHSRSRKVLVTASISRKEIKLHINSTIKNISEVHVWKFKKSNSAEYNIRSVMSDDVRLDVSRGQKRLHQGYTSFNRIMKFKRRMRRFLTKCKRKAACGRGAIFRRIRKLNLKASESVLVCL